MAMIHNSKIQKNILHKIIEYIILNNFVTKFFKIIIISKYFVTYSLGCMDGWMENMVVAMLADVSGAYSAISSVYQCVTGPL